MKCKAWLGIALVGLVMATVIQAETAEVVVEETTAEFTVDYYSAYVWRGQVFNSAAVVQPAIAVERERTQRRGQLEALAFMALGIKRHKQAVAAVDQPQPLLACIPDRAFTQARVQRAKRLDLGTGSGNGGHGGKLL